MVNFLAPVSISFTIEKFCLIETILYYATDGYMKITSYKLVICNEIIKSMAII